MSKRKVLELELEVVGMKAEVKIQGLRGLASAAGLGLLLAAIVQEMQKPAEERAWHGRLGGVIPYDLRPPTIERVRRAYWNPENRHLFTDTAFGVGWSLNLGRLAQNASSQFVRVAANDGHETGGGETPTSPI